MNKPEQLLKELIQKYELEKVSQELFRLKRDSLALILETKEDREIPIAISKLGGNPDVPEDFVWPFDDKGPLSFICQIDCSDLVELEQFNTDEKPLLSFFYNNHCWGFDPKDACGFKVYKFDKKESLVRTTPPVLPEKKTLFGLIKKEEKVRVYKSCKLKPERLVTLPTEIEFPNFSDSDYDNYYELIEELGGDNRMFGYPGQIQGEIEVECEFVANGYEGIQKVEESVYNNIRESSKHWKLLLQIDSNTEDSDMMWGDAGRLYFMIRKQDLDNSNYSNCWLISQCH